MPTVVANTSTINKMETTTRHIRVESGIAVEPGRHFYVLNTASILNYNNVLQEIYSHPINLLGKRSPPRS